MALNTNTYGYVIDPLFSFCDQGGKTIANGYVRIFRAGTSTPVLTYRNFDGAFNAETIELDNSGRTMTQVIASKGSLYKVCVYDVEHSQEDPILTVDKVAVIGASVNATNLIQGMNDVEGSGWIKSVAADDTANVSLDPTGVSDHVTSLAEFESHGQYKIPLVKDDGSQADIKVGALAQNTLLEMANLATVATAANTDKVVLLVGGVPKIISVSDFAQVIAAQTSVMIFSGILSPLNPPDGDQIWQALNDGFEVVLIMVTLGGMSYTMRRVRHEVAGSKRMMEFSTIDDDGRMHSIKYTIDDSDDTPAWEVTTSAPYLVKMQEVAPEWRSADYLDYHKDSLVSRHGVLHRCVVKSPSASWIPAEWTQTTIAAELARKGEIMKTFTLVANSGKTYTFAGNARAAIFSKVGEVIALKALSANVDDSVAVGFKAGDTVKIVAAQVKAGQAAGLQSPAMAAGVTGLSASLQLDIVALASDGTTVQTGYASVYLKELDWNKWEQKGLEVDMPAALPAGATCFGIMYSGAFSCDDYNINSAYINQTVTPEIVLEVNTSSDKLAAVSDGTDIE